MLEGLVATLLNKFLGQYISNFNPKQLKVGIWSGDVRLDNLHLKREALDAFDLPINVVHGHLGALTLKIPWSNLGGAPVQITIEDVFLLAAPKEESKYDADEEERRRLDVKRGKLVDDEMLAARKLEGMSQEEQKKNKGFTESLITKVIDNLQITVKNIHVRYEDSISNTGHPFSLGLTLDEFSAKSTDGQWKPAFIQDANGLTHKVADLSALTMYWNTDTELLSSGKESETEETDAKHDGMVSKFREMNVKDQKLDLANNQFILKPVSGHAKIEINNSGTLDKPKISAGLVFDEIGLVLDDTQFRDALMLVDTFRIFDRHREYKKLQPKGVSPKEDPKAWLKFAGDAVLSKIHERNHRWSWEFFRERRDNRIRYIELFKKKKKQTEQLTPEEVLEIETLEEKLNLEDIRFWRTLARKQLRKENVGVKKEPQKQGWIAWAWGSKQEDHEQEPEIEITEDQRQELYDAIDYDEKAAVADDETWQKDSIKFQIDASLNTGSFTLKRDPHKNVVEVLSLYFDGFRAKTLIRPEDSFLADVKLGGLRVNDGTTPDSLFTQIVRVKDAPNEPLQRLQVDGADEDVVDVTDPFFEFQFEKKPLDGTSDLALTAKLKPLEIIWNPYFLVGITQFFRPPERHMESIAALMESAGATVEGLRQQTRAGLEFVLEEHKTLNAKLDLQAPLLIIPESITTKTSVCMILDAGHISVQSKLVDHDTMKEIQAKQRQSYTAEDLERLESLMYDKFLVKLSSTQLLIGTSIEETKAQLVKRDESKSMHIVEKINVDFIVELSIIPKAPNVPKVRVSGNLPVLHAVLSDRKYKNLMTIINVAIPNFDADELPAQASQSKLAEKPKRPRPQSAISTKSDKTRERSASTSFKFSTQEAVILPDSDDDDDDDEAVFQDASAGNVDESLRILQRYIELKFKVDRLQGSMYRSDPNGEKPDQLLVEAVAENFALDMYVRPYDLVIEPSLGSLVVDDYVENPSAEFKSIISSGDRTEDAKDKKDLIRIKIVKVKPESPEFMPKYEGVEINIDVDVSTINLIVTRKTLLTLLDFVLITFTNNDSPSNAIENESEDSVDRLDDETQSELLTPPQTDSGSIRIKINLTSVHLILNNDGIRLATLSLTRADVGIHILNPKTMRIAAKLGDLTLLDDINQGASEDSNLRKLITIQGDELADFRYETFDAENPETYPGYDSSVFLSAGSVKLNFMEEPFRKIIDFLVKFGKMQAIFNTAREAAANRATQIQNSPGRFKFDVNVKTPIVVFPRVMIAGRQKRDLLTAYLGEIYAENKFVPLDDSKDSPIANQLTAGIRNIRLTSEFNYKGGRSEELELIDKVNLSFLITLADHIAGNKRPDMEIKGNMTDTNLRITQAQLKFLLELAKSVPATFAIDSEESEQQAIADVPKSVRKAASTELSTEVQHSQDKDTIVDLGPELGVQNPDSWTKLDLAFHVHTIGLELVLAKEDEPVGDLDAASLSKFSLDDTKIKLRMMTDGSLESEMLIHSFTIKDSRTKVANKFKKIMESSNKEVQQFMASMTMSGGDERNLIAIVAIDSPKVIFALDYIFALQAFVSGGLTPDEPLVIEDDESAIISGDGSETDSLNTTAAVSQQDKSLVSSRSPNTSEVEEPSMSIAFRVNIVDPQVILIANPLSASSEAIVLTIKQVLMSQQHSLTLQVSQMGMSLCRMDRFKESQLPVLDDFSLQMSMDSSKPDLTSLHIDIEPIILRLSLRDILLALQIIQKASELSEADDNNEKISAADEKTKQLGTTGSGSLKRRTASGKGASTIVKRPKSVANATPLDKVADGKKIVQRKEELTANLDGMRIVLIGDRHELPMLDLCVKKFTATANDWSSALSVNTHIDMFINIYNFSKSTWEPLVEPWELTLQASKDTDSKCMSIGLISKKTLEVTVTSATIALASKSADFLTGEEDVLSKPRENEKPYRIRNYTGFELSVWADVPGDENDTSAKLEDGEEAPWSFEDWETMRENLSLNKAGAVGIRLEGSGFDSVNKIGVDREGETLYRLRPNRDNTSHRLLVDVSLGTDNVKYITFRSPLLVENHTQIPVEVAVYDSTEGHLLKIEKIAPGESRPAPVGAAYLKSLLVRPDQGFGYTWSTEFLWWRDLLKRPTRTLTCNGENGKQTPPFYFQMHASYDKTNPRTRYVNRRTYLGIC